MSPRGALSLVVLSVALAAGSLAEAERNAVCSYVEKPENCVDVRAPKKLSEEVPLLLKGEESPASKDTVEDPEVENGTAAVGEATEGGVHAPVSIGETNAQTHEAPPAGGENGTSETDGQSTEANSAMATKLAAAFCAWLLGCFLA
ncbi:hypothetical protein TRVL_08092 [Trypanosoma vivax]|nr:hypothetical protein TRVL_08092 [Trypanosoma vivax]